MSDDTLIVTLLKYVHEQKDNVIEVYYYYAGTAGALPSIGDNIYVRGKHFNVFRRDWATNTPVPKNGPLNRLDIYVTEIEDVIPT